MLREGAWKSRLGLEDGKKLRVDTTVVETNIHYPTDSTLLWDSVRTITRLVEDLHRKLPQGVEGFTNRTRSARRRMQEIERMSARERQVQQQPKYRELIRITGQVVQNARQAIEKAKEVTGIDVAAGVAIDQLRTEIACNSSRGLSPLRQQGGSKLISAIADDRFGEISQCVAALHSAGLSDGEEAGRGHFSLGAAVAKDDFAQLHGNA